MIDPVVLVELAIMIYLTYKMLEVQKQMHEKEEPRDKVELDKYLEARK